MWRKRQCEKTGEKGKAKKSKPSGFYQTVAVLADILLHWCYDIVTCFGLILSKTHFTFLFGSFRYVFSPCPKLNWIKRWINLICLKTIYFYINSNALSILNELDLKWSSLTSSSTKVLPSYQGHYLISSKNINNIVSLIFNFSKNKIDIFLRIIFRSKCQVTTWYEKNTHYKNSLFSMNFFWKKYTT